MTTRPAHTLILLLAAALVTACDLSQIFGGRSPREQLARNRERWEALGIRDYDFNYSVSCYCLPESTRPVRIEVRGGVVDRVTNRQTGEVVQPSPYLVWPTIDSLFRWTDASFEHGYRLTIRYDAAYHFPGYIEGDIPGAVDDEFVRSADNLVRR